MIDDERTELRRDMLPVEEATRAVDRSADLDRRTAQTPAPGPAGRTARVPGRAAEAAAYGIRRSTPSAPVTRAAAVPDPVARRRAASPRRPRVGLAVVLAVASFALVLAAAAIVLVLLVAS